MYSGSRRIMSFFAYGAFTLSGWLSQNHSAKFHESLLRSEPRDARIPVWALPVSLAATSGIDVSFSSSGYLDVSVHRVPLHTLWIGVWIHGFTVWVSPFRYPWIVGYVLLPMAFRSLSRLSSALSAKASTLRSFTLDQHCMHSVACPGMVCFLLSMQPHTVFHGCMALFPARFLFPFRVRLPRMSN